MRLDWRRPHNDGSWNGHLPRKPGDSREYGPGRLAVKVIRYSDHTWVRGDDGYTRPVHAGYWWAVCPTGRGERQLDRRFPDADAAKAAAEAHVDAS